MKDLYVTSPLLPDFEDFQNSLMKIWESKYLTNNGQFHQRFEEELAKFLGVEYISLFTNGTLPLMIAFKCLELKGDVITTPYSFIATSNSLIWANLTPVFIDVDDFGNLDPNKIEEAITDNTSAILAVHVYGNPCQTEKIQKIANKHNLKVIYDAAHAFGVEKNGKSILLEGNISTLSFHATKVFNTIEGGAVICHSAEMKKKVDLLKNFGIEDEVTVSDFGINCKLDEVRSAFGLLNLKKVDESIKHRKLIAELYRNELKDVRGISFFEDIENVKHNYSYFPIFISKDYKMNRDQLYEYLKQFNIFTRRYFYPLISDFEIYSKYKKYDLSKSKTLSNSVLCLPIHDNMTIDDGKEVIRRIK